MEDESSNDIIEMDSEEQPDRPLMQFFRRLLLNNVSQNTIVTNAQIEDILIREFNFNLSSLHALEVDIYISIVKKFLKDWPMWDEVEKTTKELTAKGEYDANFVGVLEAKYRNLKAFLKSKLDMGKELSTDMVNKVKIGEKNKPKPCLEDSRNSDASNVVLEITATRKQLNKLIYQHPHPTHFNTIFNVNDKETPSHIKLNTLSLDAILNWWSVRITISLQPNSVFLIRETTHELHHLLVNRKVEDKQNKPTIVYLNHKLQIKEPKKMWPVPKQQILGCLDLLSTEHDAAIDGMETIINCVKREFENFGRVIAAPAEYRRYLSKHPYVRYLYSSLDVAKDIDKADYDIQLKETISPRNQFSVRRLDIGVDKTLPPNWLRVECVICIVTFTGEKLVSELRQHFDEYHQEEVSWQCSNCQKVFDMSYLAENLWRHECV